MILDNLLPVSPAHFALSKIEPVKSNIQSTIHSVTMQMNTYQWQNPSIFQYSLKSISIKNNKE